MSKKLHDSKDDAKKKTSSSLDAIGSSVSKAAQRRSNDDDDDSDASEDEVVRHDSDEEDEDVAAMKKAKAASDSAEKSELAAYLSTPSTYVSANPHLAVSREEAAERSEVEELLAKLKGHQKGLMDRRTANQRELEGMRGNLKKIRKVRQDRGTRSARTQEKETRGSPRLLVVPSLAFLRTRTN